MSVWCRGGEVLVGNFGCTAAHGGAAGLTTPRKVAMLSYVKQQRAYLCVMAARSRTFRVCTGRNLQLRPALPSVTAVECAGDGVQRCQQQWALPCVWRHQQVKGCACWGGEDVELCLSAETQEDCVQPVKLASQVSQSQSSSCCMLWQGLGRMFCVGVMGYHAQLCQVVSGCLLVGARVGHGCVCFSSLL